MSVVLLGLIGRTLGPATTITAGAFLGALFRRKTNNQIRNEVQIFITPEIVKDVAA